MSRYAIWNKRDPILTPVGEVLTAEQWIERFPVAGMAGITVVCAAGEINGGFFGTLGQMRQSYEAMGADFSACESDEDILRAIESFEQSPPKGEPTAQERTAAAHELREHGRRGRPFGRGGGICLIRYLRQSSSEGPFSSGPTL